ncbi:MAG: ROK family protein [Actinocatenispora sp.]
MGPGPVSLISPASLGVVNRTRVLDALHASGPQSRAELARTFGVSRATVGTILQPLLDSGVLVEEEAQARPAGGRRPRPVWFSASARALGAVEILPGRINVALLSLTGEIRHRATAAFPRRARTADAFHRALLDTCADVLDGHPVLGVGVAAAGLLEPGTGRLVELTAVPALTDYPLVESLAGRLAAPVHLEHHARVQALGDRWFGPGRGLDTFASASTGETVGVGIVHHGAVLSAPGAASGAHMTVVAGGEHCDCGKRGCWKTIATTGWLRRRAHQLDLPAAADTTLAGLRAAADGGDRTAAGLVDEYAANLAVGLGNVQQLLAPGVFILHGEAVAGGPAFRDRLAGHLIRESPRRGGSYQPIVVLADPSQETALLGCAGLVLSRALDTLR